MIGRPGQAFPSDITVAIVTHNSASRLPEVLGGVAATGCPPSQVLLVDVASEDDAIERALAECPGLRVRRMTRNEGPNPARNEALRQAGTPYVLLMDADVVLTPNVATELRAAIDDPGVAVSAPIVLHAAQPDVIQYAGGGVHFICEGVNPWIDRPAAARGTESCDIGAAPGCALLIDCERALEVGGFDERYFMGKEDGDFLHRVRIAGYRLREIPRACVLHRTTPRSDWLFMYQVRNRWHFLLRNYQWRTLVLLAPALAVHEALLFAMLLAKGHAGAWFRAIGGLLRMLPALPADRAQVARYRRVGDRQLLRDDPLVVRADFAASRGIKHAYDLWLRTYWRVVRPLVSAR
jgi:GT2 family glycosyltransferase